MDGAHETTVVADGHVHLHDCFDLDRWLDAARGNLERARPDDGDPALRVVMLTESAGVRAFAELADGRRRAGRDWSVLPTDEPNALRVVNERHGELILVAGRQVATSDGLEVLALGALEELPDGRPLETSLEATREAGAVAVVPWGFGKWWGGRGRRLAGLVDEAEPGALCLGDNGGRPRFAREPRLFARARARGLQIIPGSDPLPFVRHERRAGSAGFVLRAVIDPRRPARGLLEALRRPCSLLRPFGAGPDPLGFVRDQLAMQWRARAGAVATT